MTRFEVAKRIAKYLGININDVAWLKHDKSGLENITQFEIFWEGNVNGKLGHFSKLIKKSEHPALFKSLLA